MNLHVKYNFETTCRTILKELLDRFNFNYILTGMGSVHFQKPVPMYEYKLLSNELNKYGIQIIDNQKVILAQRIKETIITMLECDNRLPVLKISSHLSETLNENYRTLSLVFTEVCHITIENFIILRKIEMVKQLLASENISLTEISYRMHYSSVAHLSNQFKKVTGLTPTVFQKILRNRRNRHSLVN